jgi:hypothetical protein
MTVAGLISTIAYVFGVQGVDASNRLLKFFGKLQLCLVDD